MLRKTFWLFVFWGFFLGTAFAASPKEQAAAAFQNGRAHYLAGRYTEALDAFEKANQLAPHPSMLANMAQAYEGMGDLANALDQMRLFASTSSKVSDEQKAKLAELEAEVARWATISVTSDPSGADVFVKDGWRSRGKTPVTFKLPEGKHTVRVVQKEFQPYERAVRLDGKSRIDLRAKLMPILPTVSIITTPPGATIYVSELTADAAQVQPESELSPLYVAKPAGRYRVELELKGYKRWSGEIALKPEHTPPGAPLTLNATLEEAPPTGFARIEVNHVGLAIQIDGKQVGISPLAKPIELDVGVHSIDIVGPDGRPYHEMIAIEAGKERKTVIDLEVKTEKGMSGGEKWGIALMSVGGAALIGGGITGWLALSADSDLSDCRDKPTCNRTSKESDLADDVRTRALVTDILLGTGVAAAVTGVLLYCLSGDDEPSGQNVGFFPMNGGFGAVTSFTF